MGFISKAFCNWNVGIHTLVFMQLTEQSRRTWMVFLNNHQNYGHACREMVGFNIDEHVHLCMNSSKQMVRRVKHDLPLEFEPKSILEVGCSAGLNCYALQAAFPKAKVIGIDPEAGAVKAAISMKFTKTSPDFILGVGEDIPLIDGSVDLVICHTVIEHVQDVAQVIRELSRVLSTNGIVHLEAPNYVWPYEPHIEIWTIPMLGKWFVKWSAIFQGKGRLLSFLEHIKFVTPFQLERLFEENSLTWVNRVEMKLFDTASGTADIKKYRCASNILTMFGRFGVSRLLITLIGKLGLYPSVMYTLRKLSV